MENAIVRLHLFVIGKKTLGDGLNIGKRKSLFFNVAITYHVGTVFSKSQKLESGSHCSENERERVTDL